MVISTNFDLVERVRTHYASQKDQLASFLEINLDGFRFEHYEPRLNSETNNYLAILVRKLLEWDLRRRDEGHMHVDPVNRIVCVHSRNLKPYKIVRKQGVEFATLFQDSELFYGAIHEMCHMFIYANDPMNRFPPSDEIDKKGFVESLPTCEGVAHCLTFKYLDTTYSENPVGKLFLHILKNVYLPIKRKDISTRDYNLEFLRAEEAYNNDGLNGIRAILKE